MKGNERKKLTKLAKKNTCKKITKTLKLCQNCGCIPRCSEKKLGRSFETGKRNPLFRILECEPPGLRWHRRGGLCGAGGAGRRRRTLFQGGGRLREGYAWFMREQHRDGWVERRDCFRPHVCFVTMFRTILTMEWLPHPVSTRNVAPLGCCMMH